MNKDIVDYKTSEYAGKMGVAFCRGDLESAQKYTKTLLVLSGFEPGRRWRTTSKIPTNSAHSSGP